MKNFINEIVTTKKSNKYMGKVRVEYHDIPISLKIYSTSDGNKNVNIDSISICIEGRVLRLKNIDELKTFLSLMKEKYSETIVIYCHNFANEFQFLHMAFDFQDVFATGPRQVLLAKTEGIEWRDSAILANLKIDELDKLSKFKVSTDDELIKHNVWLAERIRNEAGVSKIKITASKYVRDALRNRTLRNQDKKAGGAYRRMIKNLTLELDEYKMAKLAFEGAHAHFNVSKKGRIIESVHSYDITSAYILQMAVEGFPMGKGTPITISSKSHYKKLLAGNCILSEVYFKNIRKKENVPDVILRTKNCQYSGIVNEKDGYIVSADLLKTTITDVDIETIDYFYEYDAIKFGKTYVYKKAYLPKEIIEFILELYADKQALKDIPGREDEYEAAKALLNSVYGAFVMAIIQDMTIYEKKDDGSDPWRVEEADEYEKLKEYNEDKNRWRSYLWGVWVTAYQRRSLAVGIICTGNDYVYSDTDCVKFEGNHEEFFKTYNEIIKNKIRAVAKYYDIPLEKFSPCGKILGLWLPDAEYDKFKVLGTKQYIGIKNGKVETTFAGLSKAAADYLQAEYGERAIEAFDYGLKIPAKFSGVKLVEYIDKTNPTVYTKAMDFIMSEKDTDYMWVLEKNIERTKYYG